VRVEYQIVGALGLDMLLGDPRWFPHPVRWIGRLAAVLEAPFRRALPARAAGIATVIIVVSVTGGATYAMLTAAKVVHPWLSDLLSVVVIWTCLASRDLAKHAFDVYRQLVASNLPEARRRVGWMVGRDTEHLDEPDIVRAAVESVAENTVDGVTAPLLFACLFGPIGCIV
jgi:adenosylcobinamide-phosphate synthase